MPTVPMVIPSETAMVLISSGMPAAVADALAHRVGQVAQVGVAGGGVGPGVGDRDQRLGEILVLHADRAQHGARRRPVAPGDQRLAAERERLRGSVMPDLRAAAPERTAVASPGGVRP